MFKNFILILCLIICSASCAMLKEFKKAEWKTDGYKKIEKEEIIAFSFGNSDHKCQRLQKATFCAVNSRDNKVACCPEAFNQQCKIFPRDGKRIATCESKAENPWKK